MSVETTERCDLCNVDVTCWEGSVYRGRLHRWWEWRGQSLYRERRESTTICGECWNELLRALRDRAAGPKEEVE